ncbi:hypothetical protein MBLNU459_g2629t1 [Dothideomycetes sp. NU459]
MSPKRKRTNSTYLAPLNTVLVAESSGDPDSPRSRVADHLRTLDLHQKTTSPTTCSPHPKRRVAWQGQGSAPGRQSYGVPVAMTPPRDSSAHNRAGSEMLEIAETPGAYETTRRYPSSPPLSPSPIRPLCLSFRRMQNDLAAVDMEDAQQRKKARAAPKPVTTAPPPTPITSPGDDKQQEQQEESVKVQPGPSHDLVLPTLVFRPASPTPLSDTNGTGSGNDSNSNTSTAALTPPRASRSSLSPSSSSSASPPSPYTLDLTWQDHEITGHTISPNEPDDDGEGINGIGFRPTPAIAARRAENRRRQVSEWRAREAREARQRRFEKRRVGGGGGGGGGGGYGANSGRLLGAARSHRVPSGEMRWKGEERLSPKAAAVREEGKVRGVRFAEAG